MFATSLIKFAILALVLLQVFIWRCNSQQLVQAFFDNDSNDDVSRGRKKNYEIGARVDG